MANSTITLQNVVTLAQIHTDLIPISGVGGNAGEPALSLCRDVLQTLFSAPLNWKFNRAEMPMFVTAPNRQDYLFAGASLFSIAGGTPQGVGIDLATNNALTISGATVTIKTLQQYNGSVGDVCYITGTGSNYDSTFTDNLITATWGGNSYTITVINGLTITATLTGSASGVSGSAGINDFGWLASGTRVDIQNTSSPQPISPLYTVREIQPNSYVSPNGPDKVCVLQDLGTGVLKIRFAPLPGSTPRQINLVYQKKPILVTALSDTWTPFPDELSYVYRQGFLALAYRFVNSPRSEVEYGKFQQAIMRGLGSNDREQSNVYMVPENPLVTSSGSLWPF